MRKRLPLRAIGLFTALLALALAASVSHAASSERPHVLAVHFSNDINPVTQEYIDHSIDRAERDHDAAVVIVLDTPGGLSSSMRGIVKRFLSATVPVIVYVAPPGSSADSAGAVITMASDLAAMAPQTNIGSSTPINLGGQNIGSDLRRKVVNDAAAYVGELAREHDRNPRAARLMVTKATNYGAREAKKIGLVEVVAPTVPALLKEVDGAKTVPKGYVLHTADAEIENVNMTFFQRVRDFLVDPNLIALFLSIGLIGIVVELWHPGLIFPGTVGAISLILGLYGLQILPVSATGVLLLLLSAAFLVSEAFVPAHGALAVAGGVTFVLGALMLFDPAGPGYQVSLPVALAIAGTLALLLGFAVTRVVRARRNPVLVGADRLVGEEGVVRQSGMVSLHGELWRAHAADDAPLVPGSRVRVEDVEPGLRLLVGSLSAQTQEEPS
ncbi:MAG TPA: nodulation protein NfeD [Gaiellaceae bacterium]|nr:nodulation protein NfeD [Gaiellaceae bacterium]